MRLGKKPRMREGVLLFLLAWVMLSCLGTFLSLPQNTVSGVPYAPAGADGGSNPLAPEENYQLTATGERQKKDKLPVTASVLTLLVLAIASFGASQGALSSCGLQGGTDRRCLAAGSEGPSSFLGVFRL